MNRQLLIHAEWDDEAKVWVATSDDVPGLITEAETVERLEAKLQDMIPELLELNGRPMRGDIDLSLVATKREPLRLRA